MHDPKSAHAAERAAWRAQVREEVLMPAQRICDAHHHLWGHDGDHYFAADLLADAQDGHDVRSTVYVECGWSYDEARGAVLAPVAETEFVVREDEAVQRLAGRSLVRGIIAFADMLRGAACADTLEAHAAAGGGRFCGVRHAVAWDGSPDIVAHQKSPPAGLLLDKTFQEGVRTLGRHGLAYDVWLYHPQMTELVTLARAAPDTTIVLDHLGAPLGIGPYAGRREEVLAFCREQLATLAALPNLRLKLGGIGMTVFGNRWHRREVPPNSAELAEVWADHMRWCIDTFGPARAMFESNFPPDRRSCNYRTLWNAFKRIAEPYAQAERDRLFHDTAVDVYKLTP